MLEAAILEAAWDELAVVGYADLTIEGVARRAGTSKTVLYRRWRNRAELVIAAIRGHVGPISDEVPDTGGLRGDVLALLRRLVQRYRVIAPDVLSGLMAEVHELPPDVLRNVVDAMTAILNRAAERREARPEAITPRIASLPGDLLRHDFFLTRRPVREEALREIVDEVFMPLVSTGRPGRRGGRARDGARGAG